MSREERNEPTPERDAAGPDEAQRDSREEREAAPEDGRVGFGAIVLSTLAAAIGVQSRRNKERDFASGRVAPYIVAGVVFTAIFVLTIVGVVKLVLAGAG